MEIEFPDDLAQDREMLIPTNTHPDHISSLKRTRGLLWRWLSIFNQDPDSPEADDALEIFETHLDDLEEIGVPVLFFRLEIANVLVEEDYRHGPDTLFGNEL